MKNHLLLLIALLFVQLVWAQDFQTEFVNSFDAQDTAAQRQVLAKWQASDVNDPELYTSYFNYYLQKSQQEMIMMEAMPQGEQSLSIMDSSGQAVGFLNGGVYYNPSDFGMAMAMIDSGITRFPTRLDMRFGKISALGLKKDWETYTAEIIETVEDHYEGKLAWTWAEGEAVEDPENFLLSSIQDYQYDLYGTGADSLLPKMGEISQKILSYNPDHVESLSNLSITYLLTGQLENALEPLKQAEKLRPKDHIVLGNIAQAYYMMKDSENAILYYRKVIKHGDREAVQFATKRIEELKK